MAAAESNACNLEQSSTGESATRESIFGPSVAGEPAVQEAEPPATPYLRPLVAFDFEPNDGFTLDEEELEGNYDHSSLYEEVRAETATEQHAVEEAVPPATPYLRPLEFVHFNPNDGRFALDEEAFEESDDDFTLGEEMLEGSDDMSATFEEPAQANFIFGTAPSLTDLDPEAREFVRQSRSAGHAQFGVERRSNRMAKHIADHYFYCRPFEAAPPYTALPRDSELLLEQQLNGHAIARGDPLLRPPAYMPEPCSASVFHSLANRAGASPKAVSVLRFKRRKAMH